MASRCTCLARRFWALSWRAALLALVLIYALCWLASERFSEMGWSWQGALYIRFHELEVAARVFPLSHYARERPAYAAISVHEALPAPFVLRQIELALMTDPYARDFQYDVAILQHVLAQRGGL